MYLRRIHKVLQILLSYVLGVIEYFVFLFFFYYCRRSYFRSVEAVFKISVYYTHFLYNILVEL